MDWINHLIPLCMALVDYEHSDSRSLFVLTDYLIKNSAYTKTDLSKNLYEKSDTIEERE